LQVLVNIRNAELPSKEAVVVLIGVNLLDEMVFVALLQQYIKVFRTSFAHQPIFDSRVLGYLRFFQKHPSYMLFHGLRISIYMIVCLRASTLVAVSVCRQNTWTRVSFLMVFIH